MSSRELDEIDIKIINLLQEDSRSSFQKIAEKLDIAVGTAYNRVKNLEEKGILEGYTVLVNHDMVGYSLTVIILIQADGKRLIDVENEVAKMDNVVCVYDITGDFDIAVIAKFKDRNSLNRFLKNTLSMSYVKRTVTNVVLNVVKEDSRIKIS